MDRGIIPIPPYLKHRKATVRPSQAKEEALHESGKLEDHRIRADLPTLGRLLLLAGVSQRRGNRKSGYHAARHRLENLSLDQPDADLYRQGINSLSEALENCRNSDRDRNGFECAVYKDMIERLQTRLALLDDLPEGRCEVQLRSKPTDPRVEPTG